MLEPKNSKNNKFKHPRQAGFGGQYFFWNFSVTSRFQLPKCGSSLFKRSKVWELLFQASENVGAIALNTWELSLWTLKSLGAIALKSPKWKSSRFKQQNGLVCKQADHIKTEAS